MKILVVEDNKELCDQIRDRLHMDNFEVDNVYDGGIAWDRLQQFRYDLVILDWELPTMTGPEVCKLLRDKGITSPVLFLTGRTNSEDKTAGLDSGADDYLIKPFHFKEMMARIRALLRRPQTYVSDRLTIGDITLDTVAHTVHCKSEEIHLQPREFALLEYMMRRPNEIFSSEALIDAIWPSDAEASDELVRAHIKNIRKKLGDDNQELIKTVHGVGYSIKG